MNTETNSSCCKTSGFIPLVLVAASIILILAAQLNGLMNQRKNIQTAVQNQQASVQNALQQSRLIQAGLEKVVSDVLELAQDGDPDAKAIIAKYGISRQGAPAPAASPAAK
jgi:hypothetical protein